MVMLLMDSIVRLQLWYHFSEADTKKSASIDTIYVLDYIIPFCFYSVGIGQGRPPQEI